MTPDVAIVHSTRSWAQSLHRFVADHGGARVRARIVDGRQALDEHYDVLVIDDVTSFLTPRLVADLHRAGRRLLGVHDLLEPAGADRLRELGVDDVLASNASPEQFVARIDALVLAGRADLDQELAVLSSDAAATARFDPTATAAATGRPAGKVVAVGGPPGGGGVTETALAVAIGLAADGMRTVLIDLDEVAPAVATRLGLALHPNLRTAVDVVQHGAGTLVDAIQRGPSGLLLVGGARHAVDAGTIRPGEVVDVIDDFARTADCVILDVGHRLEDLGGFGTIGRYARARAAIERADTLVGVTAGSPVGVARLLDWVADVRVINAAPMHIVLNRLTGGKFQRAELADEINRTFAPPSLTFVPEDQHVADAAWDGRPVGRGAAAKAWAPLAGQLLSRTVHA